VTRKKWDTMQVSNSDCVLSMPPELDFRDHRKPPSLSRLSVPGPVPKTPQESLFFFAEASCTLMWSRLSDHIGRKPVLMTASGFWIRSYS
jgi:hypothetical protein